MAIRTITKDPMLRLLLAAMVLAAFFPATGTWRSAAQMAANLGIFFLFLANGMRIARSEIASGIANWRFFLPLTLWMFGAMSGVGLALSHAGEAILPPLLAVGFLYLGALPTTVQSSTSYSSLAGGNIALSVIAAASMSILGVFISVPIFLSLGGSGEGMVGNDALIKIILILILPFAIGQLVQSKSAAFIAQQKPRIVWLDRLIIAFAVYVAFSGAVEQGIWTRIDGWGWAVTMGLVTLFLVVGHAGAWFAPAGLGLPRQDRIAFLFAGAQKSAAIGAPLATVLFEPAAAGFIVLPLLLYHFFQLVLAAPLATRLAARSALRPDASGYDAPTTRS
ncbi:bile acid:sodium symporter family protein [Qipengyuania seohaensis]|uniref:bile acid:sodium symporter family protein n=1 Tax=Qipengyuania seohaensis TaxID=266951 RepID=UPI000C21EE0C|nr:bile acid:sodium symporter family protein [Qipengyuania seohaensis]